MKLKKGEKGFTLIELLVSIAIASLVTAAASMTIITMMRLAPKNSDWAIALRQVQNAGYYISRDVLMSEYIEPGDKSPLFLTLVQPKYYQDETDNVTYQFEDIPGGLKRLTRTDNNTTIMVAEYISVDSTTATYSPQPCSENCTLTVTITAVSGDVEVTRIYEAAQRVPYKEPSP